MNRIYSRTKIIATVGPASNKTKILLELILAGVDVFRLNFSHGTHDEHKDVITRIRGINERYGYNIGILGDLQGPKIRLGKIEEGGVSVRRGDEFIITTKECIGNKECVYITYSNFPKDVKKDDKVLIDDGKIEVRVLETNEEDEVKVRVVYGGVITSKKGVNLPDTLVSIPSVTEKDAEDLEFALENDLDWIALSFVRSAADLIDLKQRIKNHNKNTKIIAKIEKPQAIENFDSILEETDGIMIARGDLGVELPVEEVPLIQKSLVRKCIQKAKPVIIATQMMESMIESAKPTRAEVTDVANAIIDGADAVMLSAETAMGKYPVRVIEMFRKIANRIEKQQDLIYSKELLPDQISTTFLSDAVCYSSCKLAADVDAKAIVGMTRSGYTAFLISSCRPKAKIYVFTDNPRLLSMLSLVWGVMGFYYNKMVSTDDTIYDVHEILKTNNLIETGDIVINLASMPIHRQSRTNMVKLTKIS